MAAACRQLLQFYLSEAENKISISTDYFLKEENFAKLKKAMDSKGSSSPSQKDIDSYNAAAKEINVAVNRYNQNNKELFDSRNKLINGWNDAAEDFLSKHTPRYNK